MGEGTKTAAPDVHIERPRPGPYSQDDLELGLVVLLGHENMGPTESAAHFSNDSHGRRLCRRLIIFARI